MAVASEQSRQPLDELMMAMDVVDTLRHDEAIALKELGAEARDEQMVERLRELYRSQGITVPDRILREGVESLKQNRFVYAPPPAGFQRTLALLYVRRHVWGKFLLIALVLIVAAVLAWRFLVVMPRERAAEALRIELTQQIPTGLEEAARRIDGIALEDAAKAQAERLAADGRLAAEAGNIEAARKALADLRALEAELLAVYEVRIVSRPGVPTGVTRLPDVNANATNYYLVVEAIGPDGKPITREVVSEEDGASKSVDIWAQRVPESTYEQVKRDKQSDGIVENRVLGVKERGRLTPEWKMPVGGGAITQW